MYDHTGISIGRLKGTNENNFKDTLLFITSVVWELEKQIVLA